MAKGEKRKGFKEEAVEAYRHEADIRYPFTSTKELIK